MDDAALAKQAHDQLLIHEGDKIKARARFEEIKKQQQVAFQQKLQAKQKRKEELQNAQELNQKNLIRTSNSQSSPPSGEVLFISVIAKDVVEIWEALEPEEAQEIFSVINQFLEEESKKCSCYQIWGKDGKYMFACQTVEDGINFSLKIHLRANSEKWPPFTEKLQVLKQVKVKNETEGEEDITIFNGPRFQIGIHSSQTTRKIDEATGDVSYSGAGPTRVESVAHLAQGGQVLIDAKDFEAADNTKLESCVSNCLGTFKLEGFSHGCKLFEVLPTDLKGRLKHFNQHCAQCGETIQPGQQFFKALGSVWHVDHFVCFSCDTSLSGSFLEHQGMPYCKPCYLKETASKCFGCGESTVGVYITALGHYWHPNCFSCKDCGGKAVDGINVYQHESTLYCEPCLRSLLERQQSQQ